MTRLSPLKAATRLSLANPSPAALAEAFALAKEAATWTENAGRNR